jgi:hypothetical protein
MQHLAFLALGIILRVAVSSASGHDTQTGFPNPQTLWNFGQLNASDVLYAGIPVLEEVEHVLVHNASLSGRTYSHHAIVEYFHDQLWVGWSSGLIDEDQNGQQSWAARGVLQKHSNEWHFDKPLVVVESALLPNQTSEANYTYWCDNLVCVDSRFIRRRLC